MTEQEWLASCDPLDMLKTICLNVEDPPSTIGFKRAINSRGLRLFCCACCRLVWDQLPSKRSERAIEVAESFTDGTVLSFEMRRDWSSAVDVGLTEHGLAFAAARCADDEEHLHLSPYVVVGSVSKLVHPTVLASILRDIVGNPFRPIMVSGVSGLEETPWQEEWLTEGVEKIAQVIYDDRIFDSMPELADALEEAGCRDSRILNHCRELERVPDCGTRGHDLECVGCGVRLHGHQVSEVCRRPQGPHVLGCWVLDLILGKS